MSGADFRGNAARGRGCHWRSRPGGPRSRAAGFPAPSAVAHARWRPGPIRTPCNRPRPGRSLWPRRDPLPRIVPKLRQRPNGTAPDHPGSVTNQGALDGGTGPVSHPFALFLGSPIPKPPSPRRGSPSLSVRRRISTSDGARPYTAHWARSPSRNRRASPFPPWLRGGSDASRARRALQTTAPGFRPSTQISFLPPRPKSPPHGAIDLAPPSPARSGASPLHPVPCRFRRNNPTPPPQPQGKSGITGLVLLGDQALQAPPGTRDEPSLAASIPAARRSPRRVHNSPG